MFTKDRGTHHNLLLMFTAFMLTALVFLHGCSDKQSTEKAKTTDASRQEKEWLSILGGVIGGSFSQFAGGVSRILTQQEPHLKISVGASAGSVENTRRVNDDTEALGVVFASESYLGYQRRRNFRRRGTENQYSYGDTAFHRL